jgi:hypothetical protein
MVSIQVSYLWISMRIPVRFFAGYTGIFEGIKEIENS